MKPVNRLYSLLPLALLSFAGLLSSPPASQEVIAIHGEPTHEILIQSVGVDLGHEGDPNQCGMFVSKNSRGEFIATGWPPIGGREFLVFGPDGSFLRTVGRDGAGPGEFKGIVHLTLGQDDKVYVLDSYGAEVEIFTEELEPFRTVNLHTFKSESLVGVDGGIVVNGWPLSRELAGYLAAFVSDDGEVRPLVKSDAAMSLSAHHTWARSMARGAEGTVWIAPQGEYRLEEWSLEGTLLRILERRDIPWFQPNEFEPVTRHNYQRRDSGSLHHLWLGPGGLLFVGYSRQDGDRHWDFVDAVDPDTGRLVASMQYSEGEPRIAGLFTDGTAFFGRSAIEPPGILRVILRER